MSALKALAAGVVRVFLTVIFDEVFMTTTDFMEEQEVFDLLKKKKLLFGAYAKNVVSPILFSHIRHATAVRQL
jgi:hypothetical protein